MKRYLILFLFIGVIDLAFAQAPSVKPPGYPSPTAASLGKYGDIPVSYHTGVPEISIPIYTVTQGSLSLPISLSYHSSGIRVDEVASNVGLGWSLNAGGMITRTVNGGPDEGMTSTMQGAQSGFAGWGWYKNGGILPEVMQCSPRPVSTEGPTANTFPSWGGCAKIYWEAAKGYIDTEPDLYTFNVGGSSGKFFFDAAKKVHMIPESDFYIEPINTPSYFYSWKITAPDGTKYFFGGTAKELSISDPAELSGNKQQSTSTTWYLYRIESANGEDWINLTYADDKYSFGNRGGHSVSFREFATPGGNPGEVLGSPTQAGTILGTTTVDGKRISQITTSSGYTTVDFTTAAAAREDLSTYTSGGIYNVEGANLTSKRLQFIQIAYGAKCKKFELSHDYYTAAVCSVCPSSTDFDRKRLRLNWVQESTCAGDVIIPKYEFTYNATAIARRYSLARDTWGYYNGANANVGLLPSFTNPIPGINITYTTTAVRTVDETNAKAGILTKVKYPTGGTSEFIYESHRQDTGPLVGGLRIKTLITDDGFGNTTTKNFTYQLGNVFYSPTSYEYQYPNNNDNWTGAFLGGLDFGIQHLSSPFPPMWSSHGYHIGYGIVKVDETGNGTTQYNFRNTAPSIINPALYPLKPVVAIASTSEQTQEQITNSSNTVLVTKSSSNSIIGSPPPAIQARRVSEVNCINCSLGPFDFGLYMDYYIDTYRYNPTSQGDTRDGVTSTTTLTYPAVPKHNKPWKTETTDSKGLVQKTEYTFASDAGSGAPAAMYTSTDPNFKNMLSAVTEQRSYVNGVITSKSTSQYAQRGLSILLSSERNYPSATTEFIENQYQYNDNLKIANMFDTNSSINKGYQWGYNNSLPVAEATNAQNTKYTVYTNTTSNSFINASGFTTATASPSFTVAYTGTVQLKLGTSSTTNITYVDYSGALGSGTMTLTNNQTCGYNLVSFNNVAPGTYTINLTVRSSAGSVNVSACGQVVYPDIIPSPTGITEFFYESFEEGSATGTATPHTGKKYLLGDYNTTFVMPNTRSYTIEYWYLSGTQWIYATAPFTNYMVLTLGSAIDNVRIYPTDARMKSYVYEPGLGISSVIDENGSIMYYNYDTFGRLSNIKNDKGGIEKQYSYNYKN